MKDQRLFIAILKRFSVRAYKTDVLSPSRLKQVQDIIDQRHSLMPDNGIDFLQINEIKAIDLLVAQGPYGAFIASPHVLIPYTTTRTAPLLEIGFQLQQVVVRMYREGLGSCYLGTAGRERAIIRHFELPSDSMLGSTLIYGYPKKAETRNLANYFRKPGYRTKRMPYEEFFSMHVFDNPSTVPDRLETILGAARRAPSAVNAQPWRFVYENNFLYLFVVPQVYPFVLNQKSRNIYAMHDAGIVMANIWLAYQAMGIERDWILYEQDQTGFPMVPADVLPIAKINVAE